ncbi:MAG: endolytic transglycosylase MltG [Bacteroidaceae bacterium]|nr:endolytic transglycosylase MltG [Bacteroidaceae bacterium]
MKKLLISIAVIIAIFAVAAYALFSSPFNINEKTYIYVDKDDNIDSVRVKIENAGRASNMLGFTITSWIKGFNTPRTGRFAITPGDNLFNLTRHIANGMQEPIKLTVPEVRTVDAMMAKLGKVLMIDSADIAQVINDSIFMDSLGYKKETLPCLFIPNTYEVYWNISPEILIKKLHKEKERFWNEERRAKAKANNYTIEEVVTLASIVESETSYNPEKSTIAGLYINRLKIGMPLQSDPTIIFALQDFTIRRVTHEQLKFESPYNTYINTGLPPGPIRIPSIRGIDAVLNYDHNDYLYMCAKEDFSGSHNFTNNYNEHMQNARRYQKALNARGIMK